MSSEENTAFRRKGDLGIPFVIGLFVLSTIIGVFVFRSYENSSKEITQALSEIQHKAPNLSLTDCAQETMNWFNKCDAMTQLCDSSVTRMTKVCLFNSNKADQCSQFKDDIYGYNFGAIQCAQYMKDKNLKRQKKACADIWQTVADYCKSARKFNEQNKK